MMGLFSDRNSNFCLPSISIFCTLRKIKAVSCRSSFWLILWAIQATHLARKTVGRQSQSDLVLEQLSRHEVVSLDVAPGRLDFPGSQT